MSSRSSYKYLCITVVKRFSILKKPQSDNRSNKSASIDTLKYFFNTFSISILCCDLYCLCQHCNFQNDLMIITKAKQKKNYCAKFPMEHVINSLSIDKKCINSFTFTFCTQLLADNEFKILGLQYLVYRKKYSRSGADLLVPSHKQKTLNEPNM